MPMRIYALAKELKIDSKELVDICSKAGITGKGSALASLDDGEVDKLKVFLSGGGKKSAPAPKPMERPATPAEPVKPVKPVKPTKLTKPVESAEPRRYTRDDYIGPIGGGKVRVLGARTPLGTTSTEAKTAEKRDGSKPKKEKTTRH